MTAPQAPGTRVYAQTQTPATAIVATTGVWFVAGLTQRGTVGRPITLTSLADYALYCGARTPATATLYDALELYFRDGGAQAVVSRRVGPAAASAVLLLKDQGASGGANTLQIAANSPGTWGNQLTVAVTITGSTYTITITGPGGVETSPTLSTPTDAVNWSTRSQYVKIVDQGSSATAPANNPAALTATNLAGGADDNASVTDATLAADLAVLTSDLGPGQVSVPGATTDAAHQTILGHATTYNRIALLDALDTPVTASLVTAAANSAATQTDPTAAAHGALFAPWIIIPGVPASGPIPTAMRTVAPSALAAAGCARIDQGGNPNVAPAGDQGISSYAVGVTQSYSDTDRARLNSAGVNISRYFANYGQVKLYGFRSFSPDPLHTQLSWSRLDMAIFHDARRIGGQVALFGQIDARDQIFSRLQGALTGMLQGYWAAGALYGTQPGDAFVVDVGSDVNTLATRQAGQINAAIALKRAPFGEFVQIGIVSVSLATPL